MPALLTRMSTPPNAATTAATPSMTAFSSVTSIATPSAWPPLARISAAVASAASLARSAIATLAPSPAKTSAMSLPMPLAAPVMMAVLSLSFMVISFRGKRLASARPEAGSAREVEGANALHGLGRAAPFRVGARSPDVLEPGFPELSHLGAGKQVVLVARRIGRPAIDQMHDRDPLPLPAQRREPLVVRILAQLRRQLVEQPRHGRPYPLEFLRARGVEARLARVLDVLGALQYLVEVLRQRAPGAEQVDLRDQGIESGRIVEHIPQRRVGHDAAVPVVVALDDDRRQARWQRPAGHDVFRTDCLPLTVEIDRVAGVDVDRADR